MSFVMVARQLRISLALGLVLLVPVIALTTGSLPRVVAEQLDSDKMYWTEAHNGKIQRADLDGTNIEDLVTGIHFGEGLALDVAAGKMYWSDPADEMILRANLDGSSIEVLIDPVEGFSPRALALDLKAVDSPPPVGGVSLDPDLSPLPLEAASPESRSWGIALGIAAAASLVAVGAATWYVRRRLSSS